MVYIPFISSKLWKIDSVQYHVGTLLTLVLGCDEFMRKVWVFTLMLVN